MRTPFLYKTVTAVTLLSLLMLACRWTAPTPSIPTPPPYTPPPPGAVPVVVIQRTPARGEELPPDADIVLVFDRAMDQASLGAAFQLSPEVDGTLEWADARTVHFQPDRPLKRDAEYLVTVDSKAKASDGNPLDGAYRFRFRTVGYLEVAQVIPAPDSEEAEAASTVTVIFNRPVVPLTAVSDPAYADLPQPVSFDPTVDGEGEWLNTSIYVFAPSDPLTGGTTYTARIRAGLADTTGGVLGEDYEWSFSTQPPQIVWAAPYEDSELVGVDTDVQITFNMAVDCESVARAASLRARLATVPGSTSCDGEAVTFTPDERLAFDTTYTMRIDAGVQSTGGGRGMRDAYEYRFTTVPLPRIIGTNPSDGERQAWPHTDFEIQFNTPIDPDSVMPSLEMSPALSPTQVYTYFRSWDNTFVLSFGAQPSSDYEVRIGADIADPYGNVTGQETAVRFGTAALSPWVNISVPGTVGTFDAHQPARVLAGFLNTSRLDLNLYQLGLDEFVRAQEDWWDYQPTTMPIRRWTIPTEAPLNEVGYSLVDLVEGGGTLTPGTYLVDMKAPGAEYDRWSHRKLLVVSDYNVTLKTSRDETWVWVTDLATGRPTSRIALTAWDSHGASLGGATSDADGLARFPFGNTDRGTLFVAAEDPFILGGNGWEWGAGVSPWDFGLEADYGDLAYRAHVYTDRPIYRPDQTVYFRGIVRAEDDVRYTLPDAGLVSVVIYDTIGEELFNEELELDEFGAFDGQIELAEGAALGEYAVMATYGYETFYADFQVAAYRPPEFEVVVTPEQEELASGQTTSAEVKVRYFFGGPVADVNVDWNVLSAPYRFEPAQFGRYDFTDADSPWICRWCWWWEPPTRDSVLSGSGTTDIDGQLAIAPPSDVISGGHQLTIEATAYGRDGQAISGRANVTVHKGEFYAGLAPQQYVGKAGQEQGIDVVTVDWAGERLPGQRLEVEISRREWVNTFVEDEFGGGAWEWEKEDTLVHSEELTTNNDAEGVVTFTPEAGGSYRIVVSGRDRRERLVRSSTWVWVSGTEYVSWRRENNDRITLISDKSTYTPGETAEILIPSPFAGEQWAWVTIERGGILHQEIVRMESNSLVYRLPVSADHAPNVYVSATIIKGPDETEPAATHKMGYVLLTVETVEQELDITLTANVEQAEPGDRVSLDIRVTEVSGEPVRTTLSLDLVDKAVLSLQPRVPNAILEAFYGRRALGVSTASGLVLSVNRLLLQQMEEMGELFATSTQDLGGMGGGGDEDALAEEPMGTMAPAPAAEAEGARMDRATELPPDVQLREQFADTAFWDATVITDQSGQATIEIELPDNLTTWVFRGVGVTARTHVGEATGELLVTKPLLVRPVSPRFLVVDDRAHLTALVSNNTGDAQEVKVTLHAEGLDLEDAATQTVSIPTGSESKVSWWVTVNDVESVDVKMSAVAGEYSDAARPRLTTGPDGTLLVHRYTAPEIVGTGGQLVEEDSRTEVVALPPRYDDRRGVLTIRLDPSLAAGMRDGLSYLEHFPYECTEQTVSRFLPNVLTYRALRDLGLSDPELEAKLPDLVEEGVSKLTNQQHGDGGWGWWHEGESNPYLTAYVVFALAKARDAGFGARGDVLRNGLSHVESTLVRARELQSYREANRQAFALFVMAETGQTGRASEYVSDLYRRREKLSHYGRAFLAMTMGRIKEDDRRIKTLLADLQNVAILSATGAHWEEAETDWWAMNTDTRSTAVILDALTQLDPENAIIPQVVRWLMIARQDGIWETTQETAWALIALTDWMVVTGELRGDYEYGVWLNDEVEADGAVTPETVDEPIRLQIDVAELLADVGNRLTVRRGPGEGRLYYTAHLKVFLPVEDIKPLNRGIIVSRRYTDPACSDGAKCPEVNHVAVGDVVQVRLTIIAPHDLYYLVVEDPLPAGAEPIDVTLDTTSLLEQQPGLYRETENESLYDFTYWWWRWYSRSEMRDDKAVLFADYLAAGTYEYTYTFRATLPGEYQVIPTTANEFYFPEVFGRADGRLFTIEEE